MDRQRFLIPALALLTVWRLALLPTIELSPDEALALFYTKHPALWYLEMGPLVPWLVKLGTLIAGEGALGVRLFAPFLALAATLCLWRLVRGLLGLGVAAWAVLLLQVLPAFNVAAISMTSSIVGLALVLGLMTSLRYALQRSAVWNVGWWLAALCLLGAILADWRYGLAYGCTGLALGLPRRRRHHLLAPGFALITSAFVIGISLMVTWNVSLGWPIWDGGEAEPAWHLFPNVLRWMILLSPVVMTLLVWSLMRYLPRWRGWSADELLLPTFMLPFALLDFGWGPREHWPHTGFILWLAPAMALLADQTLVELRLEMRRKILLRSGAIFIAGLQSMVLMRTDMLRSVGIIWPFQKEVAAGLDYRHFLWADPSSGMRGWEQSAGVLNGVLAGTHQPDAPKWFIIARDWPLAVGLEWSLPAAATLLQPTPQHPRVHVIQTPERTSPHALLPRYDELRDAQSAFAGRNALYVTDAAAMRPPAEIRSSFERTEALSHARLMHGGQEVRTIKIFACYGYKPPDL